MRMYVDDNEGIGPSVGITQCYLSSGTWRRRSGNTPMELPREQADYLAAMAPSYAQQCVPADDPQIRPNAAQKAAAVMPWPSTFRFQPIVIPALNDCVYRRDGDAAMPGISCRGHDWSSGLAGDLIEFCTYDLIEYGTVTANPCKLEQSVGSISIMHTAYGLGVSSMATRGSRRRSYQSAIIQFPDAPAEHFSMPSTVTTRCLTIH